MTTNKPEVVAWRWRKPVVDDRGETVGATAWELSDAPGFLPWWTNDPLIRLSDYESLQAAYERLRKHLQNLIDQTTPLEPEPGNPMWSRRIQLDEVIAERDQLRAECEKLRGLLAEIGRGCSRLVMPSEQTIAIWAEAINAAMAGIGESQ